jgi:hypothetical protein
MTRKTRASQKYRIPLTQSIHLRKVKENREKVCRAFNLSLEVRSVVHWISGSSVAAKGRSYSHELLTSAARERGTPPTGKNGRKQVNDDYREAIDSRKRAMKTSVSFVNQSMS